MIKDYSSEFNKFSDAELHAIYGINCYQYATGLNTPIFRFKRERENERSPEDTIYSISYLTLQPGTLDITDDFTDRSAFIQHVKNECEKDGIVFTDKKPDQNDERRIIALFKKPDENQIPDVHFAFINSAGNLEDKMTFNEPKQHGTIQDIETETGYQFVSYGTYDDFKSQMLKTLTSCRIDIGEGRAVDVLNETALNRTDIGFKNLLWDPTKNGCFIPEVRGVVPSPKITKDILSLAL